MRNVTWQQVCILPYCRPSCLVTMVTMGGDLLVGVLASHPFCFFLCAMFLGNKCLLLFTTGLSCQCAGKPLFFSHAQSFLATSVYLSLLQAFLLVCWQAILFSHAQSDLTISVYVCVLQGLGATRGYKDVSCRTSCWCAGKPYFLLFHMHNVSFQEVCT